MHGQHSSHALNGHAPIVVRRHQKANDTSRDFPDKEALSEKARFLVQSLRRRSALSWGEGGVAVSRELPGNSSHPPPPAPGNVSSRRKTSLAQIKDEYFLFLCD